MSKNFRSSFIDVLCCRYSKRRLFSVNPSTRSRRVTENYIKNFNTKYRPSDLKIRSSVASRFSQLTPMNGISNASGSTAFSSSSRLTTELLPQYDQRDSVNGENKLPIDYNSSCHITVGTQTNTVNKTHRRRKHGDRSPVVAYCSLPIQSIPKSTEVLCT